MTAKPILLPVVSSVAGFGILSLFPANALPQVKVDNTPPKAESIPRVMVQQLTDELAEAFDLKGASGALVGDVTDDSPAEHAGKLEAKFRNGVLTITAARAATPSASGRQTAID